MRHFLFHSTDAAGGKKNEPRRGMGARWRGSGHGYYFLTAEVLLTEKPKNCSQKSATSFSGRAAG
jgi:hypothetical protein